MYNIRERERKKKRKKTVKRRKRENIQQMEEKMDRTHEIIFIPRMEEKNTGRHKSK